MLVSSCFSQLPRIDSILARTFILLTSADLQFATPASGQKAEKSWRPPISEKIFYFIRIQRISGCHARKENGIVAIEEYIIMGEHITNRFFVPKSAI